MKTQILISLLCLTLVSCGGGGASEAGTSGVRTLTTDPSGLWLVRFLDVFDECELLPEDVDFFEDEHEVTISGEEVSLISLDLPLGEYEGAVRGEDSFVVSSLLEGDLFGVGFNCALTEDLAYNNLTENTATVLYLVSIVCDDGSRCDSTLRGVAEPLTGESLLRPEG